MPTVDEEAVFRQIFINPEDFAEKVVLKRKSAINFGVFDEDDLPIELFDIPVKEKTKSKMPKTGFLDLLKLHEGTRILTISVFDENKNCTFHSRQIFVPFIENEEICFAIDTEIDRMAENNINFYVTQEAKTFMTDNGFII